MSARWWLLLGIGSVGCGAARPALQASLAPATELVTAPLEADHFKGDHAAGISEEDLKRILAAPVRLEVGARVGVVPVADRYDPDHELPLVEVPAALGAALESTGLFEVVSEVSTDWPADRSVSGLRELAARYRTGYLLLVRHRFVDRSHANAWAFGCLTLLGTLFLPATTVEAAGVVEATLFEVKTGTIMFTVYTRVSGQENDNLWQPERKLLQLEHRLLGEAAQGLANQVSAKVRRLAVDSAANGAKVSEARTATPSSS